MGVMDRLRPNPRWKDKDPVVRAAGVEDLPEDQHEVLRALATEDPDVRVRRAAVRRLVDPEVLGTLARGDENRKVRDEACEVLVGLASVEPDSGRAQAALASLSEPKHLARVARVAASDTLRRSALARLDDRKALGSVARHALDAGIRLAALERITDESESGTVAMKSDHEDSALAALAQIRDPHLLKAVALKAKHDAVVLRAREMLAALEQAPKPPDPEVLRAQAVEICHSMEFLLHSDNWDRARLQMAKTEAEWQALGWDADEELSRRFEEAKDALREQIARHDAERSEMRHHLEEVGHGIAARTALCREVEAIQGDGAPARLERARADWLTLPPITHPKVETLNHRFERACSACLHRHETLEAHGARRTQRETLCLEAEALAGSEDLAGARTRWPELQREWLSLHADDNQDADLEERFRGSETHLAEREAAARREVSLTRQANLQRLSALCDDLEPRLPAEDLTLRDAERGLRAVRKALQEAAPVPTKRDREQILERLKKLKTGLGARLHDLIEIGEWKQWVDTNVQEDLCARMEALVGLEDLDKATRKLRELERRWRRARIGAREAPEPIRLRFEAARDAVRSRCEAHLSRQSEEHAVNLKAKEALCERAEALAELSDWIKTAEEIKAIQAEWKTVGPVARASTRAVWERFRAPCDRFFTRRKADLDRRKEQWAERQTRKEELCARAESLADSTEWEATAAELKRLQIEWKTIGPLRKSRGEILGRRLRQACDRFFERLGRREEIEREARQAEREVLCREIEEMLPLEDATSAPAPEGLAGRVIALRVRWQKGGAAPPSSGDPLSDRFLRAIERLAGLHPESFRGTDLDFGATRGKMEQICTRLEGFLPGTGPQSDPGASPAAILAAHLREALASNTMGGRKAEESRWHSSAEEVKKLQAAWQRLGPLPGEPGLALQARFKDACQRFFAQRPPSPPPEESRSRDRRPSSRDRGSSSRGRGPASRFRGQAARDGGKASGDRGAESQRRR